MTNLPYLTNRCALVCLDASAHGDTGCGESEGPGMSADGWRTDPGCQGQCQMLRTIVHPSWKQWNSFPSYACVGGNAASSGCLRCFDPPEPQASPSAQPGYRPSHPQLQQGRHERRHQPGRRGPPSHRLQPSVPLLGRA